MTPQTRALIEAAEEVLNIWAMPKSIYLKLRAAISSAKAAEEGVEVAYKCRSCNMTLTEAGHKNWVGCDVCEGEGLISVREKEGLHGQ